MKVFTHTITGYLVGDLYWPFTEVYKPISYELQEGESLRHAVVNATYWSDVRGGAGDIAEGVLETTLKIFHQRGTYTRTRTIPLERFQSVKDCLRVEWDGPSVKDFS